MFVCSVLLCCLFVVDDNSTVDIALSTPWFIRRAGSRTTCLAQVETEAQGGPGL